MLLLVLYNYRFRLLLLLVFDNYRFVLVKFSDSSVNNLPKDSDLYLAKKNEAYQKYEM